MPMVKEIKVGDLLCAAVHEIDPQKGRVTFLFTGTPQGNRLVHNALHSVVGARRKAVHANEAWIELGEGHHLSWLERWAITFLQGLESVARRAQQVQESRFRDPFSIR